MNMESRESSEDRDCDMGTSDDRGSGELVEEVSPSDIFEENTDSLPDTHDADIFTNSFSGPHIFADDGADALGMVEGSSMQHYTGIVGATTY